jgi:hypothetical protein
VRLDQVSVEAWASKSALLVAERLEVSGDSHIDVVVVGLQQHLSSERPGERLCSVVIAFERDCPVLTRASNKGGVRVGGGALLVDPGWHRARQR